MDFKMMSSNLLHSSEAEIEENRLVQLLVPANHLDEKDMSCIKNSLVLNLICCPLLLCEFIEGFAQTFTLSTVPTYTGNQNLRLYHPYYFVKRI
jgi:hypothetical protein